jgi:hypothetical protein
VPGPRDAAESPDLVWIDVPDDVDLGEQVNVEPRR